MKRRIFSIFFALVLVLTLGLVTAVPVAAVAQSTFTVTGGTYTTVPTEPQTDPETGTIAATLAGTWDSAVIGDFTATGEGGLYVVMAEPRWGTTANISVSGTLSELEITFEGTAVRTEGDPITDDEVTGIAGTITIQPDGSFVADLTGDIPGELVVEIDIIGTMAVEVEGADVTLLMLENVYRPAEFGVSSTTTNLGWEYANVRFNITLSGPDPFTEPRENTFTITTATPWPGVTPEEAGASVSSTFNLIGGNWVGYWGPEPGFPMPAKYGPITADFTVQMNDEGVTPATLGDYEVTVELVDINDSSAVLATVTESFSLSDDTLYVGVGEQFTAIQAAIDAAGDNDTINVAAGTYTEQVNIEESLTITGSGQDTTHIVCPGAASMTFYDEFGSKGSSVRYSGHRGTNLPIVRIAASDVTFQGFHIDYSGENLLHQEGKEYSRGVGILVDHVETVSGTPDIFTGITIQNNKIDGMLDDKADEGIKVLAQATVSILTNTIYCDGESAISAQGVDSPIRAAFYPTVTANSNTIYGGTHAHPLTVFFGIGYWSGATGSADDNTIYNVPNDRGYALNSWTPNPVSFTNNFIYTDGEGEAVGGYGAQLFESSNLIFSGNHVQDQELAGAIGGAGGGTDVTITLTNNNITNCIDGFSCNALKTGSVTLHYNNFSGIADGHYALDMVNPALSSFGWLTPVPCTITADATLNWWGDVAGPKTESEGTLHNPYENWTTGAAVSNNVDYLPWLIQVELVAGWNIWSDPIAIDEACLPQLDAAFTEETVAIAYYFDSSEQKWSNIQEDASRMDAWYVKMKTPVTVNVWASSEATFPSQKEMKVGWNFVGLAELVPMPAPMALASAYYGTGEAGLWGYSQVMSPSLNGEKWTFLRVGQDVPWPPEETVPKMIPTKGYWVLMVNDGVLGGYTQTPIVEVEVPLPLPPES